MGAPLTLKPRDLANVRKWRIKGFDQHLVFYEPRPDGVSIVRVLHAARDWWGLLGFADSGRYRAGKYIPRACDRLEPP